MPEIEEFAISSKQKIVYLNVNPVDDDTKKIMHLEKYINDIGKGKRNKTYECVTNEKVMDDNDPYDKRLRHVTNCKVKAKTLFKYRSHDPNTDKNLF